mgnify:CR=1 FL=1
MKVCFIVFCIYAGSLFFREERVPGGLVEWAFRKILPDSLVLHVDSASFGFVRGVHVQGFRLYDLQGEDPLAPTVSASSVAFNPFSRQVEIVDLSYPRLPDGYYAPGNSDRDQRGLCEVLHLR